MSKRQKGRTKEGLLSSPSAWFSTEELLEYLGISNAELDRELKLFTEGVHYKYEVPKDKNSRILWRIDLVDEILCLPIAPLEKEAMLNAINNKITCHE